MESQWINNMDAVMALRLLLAAIFGGIVGLERGRGDRPAGFRTHILVCLGSALFMLVSMYGFDVVPLGADRPMVEPRRDSARVAAQVVSGIGFLGAGTIVHEGLTIKGLTTAASLWIVSAIGLAVGGGMYLVSGLATLLTLVTLVTFHTVEQRISSLSNPDRQFVRIVATNRSQVVSDITDYLVLSGAQPRSINVKKSKLKAQLFIDLYMKVPKGMKVQEVLKGVSEIEGVVSTKIAF